MKLIDILNLIAKGELEEGTKIRYSGNVFVYKDSLLLNTQNKDNFSIYGWGSLNEEVEIIGHDTNVATKIGEVHYTVGALEHPSYNESWLMNCVRANRDKLNEVIREINRRGE